MRKLNYEKLALQLKPGRVYRRSALKAASRAIDRDLVLLVQNGFLEKVAPGLYYKPKSSRFGSLPAADNELVKNFLRDDQFLLYSWNEYNALDVGLTQLYNRQIVYNYKRHGLFELGGKKYDFRRPARGFPEAMSREFLLVDLMNNLHELAEDHELLKKQIRLSLGKFNLPKLKEFVHRYGKISTRKFFTSII